MELRTNENHIARPHLIKGKSEYETIKRLCNHEKLLEFNLECTRYFEPSFCWDDVFMHCIQMLISVPRDLV